MTQLVSLTLIHWIVIYLVDSAIQLLNNWGQISTDLTGSTAEDLSFEYGLTRILLTNSKSRTSPHSIIRLNI